MWPGSGPRPQRPHAPSLRPEREPAPVESATDRQRQTSSAALRGPRPAIWNDRDANITLPPLVPLDSRGQATVRGSVDGAILGVRALAPVLSLSTTTWHPSPCEKPSLCRSSAESMPVSRGAVERARPGPRTPHVVGRQVTQYQGLTVVTLWASASWSLEGFKASQPTGFCGSPWGTWTLRSAGSSARDEDRHAPMPAPIIARQRPAATFR